MSDATHSFCIIVPHYNHARQLEPVLAEIAAQGLPVIVVDDGSSEAMRGELERIAEPYGAVSLVYREHNGGKGAAVMTGYAAALEAGFSHAIQIDADGQHNVADVPRLIAASKRAPERIVSAMPVFGPDVPKSRLHGRKLTTWCVMLETCSTQIRDAMCGFRVYPLAAVQAVCNGPDVRARMQFDIEILVRWCWSGGEIDFVPSQVRYPENGLSHFRMVRDNATFVLLHTRLIAGMLVRLPVLIRRRLRGPALVAD
ncbi:MAG: glycosyltransferase family 2 protein [Pseudomonadota bacterium]